MSLIGKGRRPRDGRRARESVLLALVLLLAGWGAFALARDLAGMLAVEARGPAMAEEPAPIALARCEGSLSEARTRMNRDPGDADACLRVASLELRRAELLALVTYEQEYGPDWRRILRPAPDTAEWRSTFLRADPERCLTRATAAARASARDGGDRERQRQALELLATVRAALGDHRGEAAALTAAVSRAPDRAALWMRLAEARGRTGQFARSEAARARGLALIETTAE